MNIECEIATPTYLKDYIRRTLIGNNIFVGFKVDFSTNFHPNYNREFRVAYIKERLQPFVPLKSYCNSTRTSKAGVEVFSPKLHVINHLREPVQIVHRH